MIFGRGARAKTTGGLSSFLFFFWLKILAAKFFFLGLGPPLAPTWVRSCALVKLLERGFEFVKNVLRCCVGV